MKLGPDMHHLNTFNIPKHEGVAFIKPPEPAQLLHHLKPNQVMLKRKGFCTAIHNHLTLALT